MTKSHFTRVQSYCKKKGHGKKTNEMARALHQAFGKGVGSYGKVHNGKRKLYPFYPYDTGIDAENNAAKAPT